MFGKVVFAFFALFVVATEAQSCSAALLVNSTYVCPDTLTLSGSVCCNYTGYTLTNCSNALLVNGSYVCPSTLVVSGSLCCYATTNTTTTTSSTCVDLVNARTGVSDCPSRAYLCNNTVYYTLMVRLSSDIVSRDSEITNPRSFM